MKLRRSILTALLGLLLVSLSARAQPELEETLRRLPRLGTIVYVTAHPDDESGPIITYLARGLHARVVILCLTRGEGGQNMMGPELNEELGEVRAHEFAQVVSGYGAEVRFLGATDFGYSKSVEETLRIWDEPTILAELVRQIRALRPLAVISNWTGTPSDGSAHHQAAGLLTRHAFAAAGDRSAFPEQFAQGYRRWQPRYLLVRFWSGEENTFEVPVDQPSPVPGKTYTDLGWEAFREHRSQGMHLITVPRRWRQFLRVEATLEHGPPAPTSAAELVPDLAALPDLFPSVEPLAEWRERLAQVVELAAAARGQVDENEPSEAGLALVQAAGLLAGLVRELPADTDNLEVNSVRALAQDRQAGFLEAAARLAGVEFSAVSDRAGVTPGEQAWVRLALRVGNPGVFRAVGFQFGSLHLDIPAGWHVEPVAAETTAEEQSSEFLVGIPENLDPRRAPPTPFRGRAILTTGSQQLELSSAVRGLGRAELVRRSLLEQLDPRRLRAWLRLKPAEEEESQTREAKLEPLTVVPAVTLEVEPPQRLVPVRPGETTHEWCVKLEAHRPNFGKLSTWLEVPVGWYTPAPQPTELNHIGERVTTCFPLTLPGNIPPGRYELPAVAGRGIETFHLARRQRFVPGGAPAYDYVPAQTVVEFVDIDLPAGLRIGYVGFNNDPEPALLSQLGITVDLLDEGTLAQAQLENYDAIVLANRSYDYRPDVPEQTPRLLSYVEAGGLLLVEHQGRRWNPAEFAPYPGVKQPNRLLRVSDETAGVKVRVPAHPVFNFPNTIGPEDWKGWVQERGLFFWESWDEHYTPLLEMADPGEPAQQGALLYARHGKGAYIYCGLALFRQLRAGVPGGVRLYVNLLSQGRALREAASDEEQSPE